MVKSGLLPICLLFLISTPVFAQQAMPELDQAMNQFYPNEQDPGVMLYITAENNQLIYSKGSGKADLRTSTSIDSSTNFRMASVSKQFTALAIRYLHAQNKLKFDQKVTDFFPQLTGNQQLITIANLLNHTSGIVDYENLIPSNQHVQLNDANVLDLISTDNVLYFSPGTKFRYSNTGYCLLSLIVEKVTGMKYENFMKDILFKDIKMDNSTVFNKLDSIGNRAFGYHKVDTDFQLADQSITSATKGDGGVYTSAKDFHNASLSLIRDVESILKDSVQSKNLKSAVNDKINYAQGLFIGLDNYNNKIYFHSGESTGFHNIVVMIPNRQLCITLFSNRDDLQIAPFFDQVLQLMDIKIEGIEGESLFLWLNQVYANQIS